MPSMISPEWLRQLARERGEPQMSNDKVQMEKSLGERKNEL